MRAKLVYIGAIVVLAFASASGTSRQSGRQAGSKIQVVFQEQANGDYRLYVFGPDRVLTCEEKDVKVVGQPDNVSPLVVACEHGEEK